MNTSPYASDREARRVVAASSVGNFVEWYDFVIFGFSIAIVADVFFPSEEGATGVLAALAVYGVAFLARPLGGMFFGSLGDRIGRRNTLAISILLMSGSTAAIGLLPSHASIGIFAPLLLVVARLLQGFSAGGEFTGIATFVSEHVQPDKRGLFVAGVSSFSLVGAASAALTVLVFTSVSADAYTAWGWRVPFLIGGLIALVGLYLRMRLNETPAFLELEERQVVKHTPLRDAVRQHPRQLVLMFFVFGYLGLAGHSILGYLPLYLAEEHGMDSTTTLVAGSVILLVGAAICVISGKVSDVVGRKPVIIAALVFGAILTVPAFLAIRIGGDLTGAILGQLLLVTPYATLAGAMLPAVVEMLPPSVRFAATALGYNAAYMVFGGTAPFMGALLVTWTGHPLGAAVYITAIALVALVTALVGLAGSQPVVTAQQPRTTAAEPDPSNKAAAPRLEL